MLTDTAPLLRRQNGGERAWGTGSAALTCLTLASRFILHRPEPRSKRHHIIKNIYISREENNDNAHS